MTSPAADTMIDSVLESAKEHRLAKLDRISVLSVQEEEEEDDADSDGGTLRLRAAAAMALPLSAELLPGFLGGNPRE